ncbi:MAG: hypothetical protein NTW08_06770 [Gammaproteobacteria bacterium]|nr:hypothetical protein [Gammaproteobacteria bacterium]
MSVVQVATPEVSSRAVQPMDEPFAVKLTVPVGVHPLELTLALKVTKGRKTFEKTTM